MYETVEQVEALFDSPKQRTKALPGFAGLSAHRSKQGWHGFVFSIRAYDTRRGEYLPLKTLPAGTTSKQAVAAWVEIAGAVNRGERPVAANIKLNEVAKEAWVTLDAEVAAGNKSGRTASGYKDLYRLHVEDELGRLSMKKIDRRDLLEWRDKLVASGLAPFTVNNAVNALAYVYRIAFERGYVPAPLSAMVGRGFRPTQAPRDGWEARVLRPEDIAKIVKAAPAEWKAPIAVLAGTGVRLSECAGLTWGDISFTRGTVSVEQQLGLGTSERVATKTHRGVRSLPMTQATTEILMEHFKDMDARGLASDGDFLFISNRNGGTDKPFRATSLSKAVQRIADKLGLGHVTAQVLRRSYCTALAAMINRGEVDLTLADAASFTGHSLQVFIDSYVKSYDDDRTFTAAREALAGMGL